MDSPVKVGDTAPDFTLNDQNGQPLTLAGLVGHSNIVLFFYPKDNTAGCTAEACAFRDRYAVFGASGAEVVGISSDSEASHREFANRHCLPFHLLSDPGGLIRKRYGVPKSLGLLPGRVTYLIDRQGIVRHIFSSQLNIDGHITKALRALQALV